MRIEKALELKVGNMVSCPADRGDPAFRGPVTHISPVPCKNHVGEDCIWVEVQRPGRHKSVWPSNRLS